MRFEEAHSVGFIKRTLLQVYSRRIDMSSRETNALAYAFAAYNKCGKRFTVIVIIILLSCGDLSTELIRHKAFFFKHYDRFLYTFALGFSAVKEFLVIVAISVCVVYHVFGKRFKRVLLRIEQLFFKLLCLCFFF